MILYFVTAVLAAVPALLAAWLFIEVVAARRTDTRALADHPSLGPLAVLVPAHDEEIGIRATLSALIGQLRSQDQILVVADNCTDGTASASREAGARVVERFDDGRRGKGYALAYGVDALRAAPPCVVIVMDADCMPAAGALQLLASAAERTGRPVQAMNRMTAPPQAPLRVRIAQLAWIVKNEARALGAHRMGLASQLAGTGMAFPWHIVADAPLASGHLAEDLQLGIALASRGQAAMFVPQACVSSAFPTNDEALRTQRTRWEHGNLSLIRSGVPTLVRAAFQRRDWRLILSALDVAIPPLASLVLTLIAAALLGGVVALNGGGLLPLMISAGGLVVVTSSVLIARNRFARKVVSMRELASIPMYLLWKLPIYARVLLGRKQAAWIRTERDTTIQ